MVEEVIWFSLLQFQLVLLHPLFHIVQYHLRVHNVHHNLYFGPRFHFHLNNTLLSANNWDVITLLNWFQNLES